MDLRLVGRRTAILGGSSGIGLASARLMGEEGARLVLVSRSRAKLAAAGDALEKVTGRAPEAVVPADLTRPEGARRMADLLRTRWGELDCLVSAVGGSIRSAFPDLSDEDWLANYELNVLSAVRAIRSLLPLLREGNAPAVVLLGAASARMPHPRQVVSNTHKAALLGLTRTLAEEFAGEGIRVNTVAPGRTLTPLWRDRAARMAAERGVPEAEILDEFAAPIPLGRFAEPEEVAVMVAWLASPRAAYVTGQTVNVDGGLARGVP